MQPQPFYLPHNLHPAYHLRYGWTGWPSSGPLPPLPPPGLLDSLAHAWETDGLRLVEHRWGTSQIQLTFSTTPQTPPQLVAARAKGRLQHALAHAGCDARFARNFAVRAIGDNTRAAVEAYVRGQASRSDLADPSLVRLLDAYRIVDPNVTLASPVPTGSGRYWYVLHLVLVVAARDRMGNRETLAALRNMALRLGRAKGIGIADLSFMPDHMHAVVRPPPGMSPEVVALAFQNNLAWAAGKCRVWEDTYYVGTCGEYTMGAVRKR